MTEAADPCTRTAFHGRTCIARLAEGWVTPLDLCAPCMRAFMDALDRAEAGLSWSEVYVKQAAEVAP